MSSKITTAINRVPSILALLHSERRAPPRAEDVQPPRPLTNLPPVDMVDIRAVIRKWDE